MSIETTPHRNLFENLIKRREKVSKKPTTAKRALELVEMGKAEYKSMEHVDPFTDATCHYVIIRGRRKFVLFGPRATEYVDLGEFRPGTGTAVIPGTLRGNLTDEPVYENTKRG